MIFLAVREYQSIANYRIPKSYEIVLRDFFMNSHINQTVLVHYPNSA